MYATRYIYLFAEVKQFFFPVPPHVHIDFTVLLPSCGRRVTDFSGWGANRVHLLCPDNVSDDIRMNVEYLNSTSYSDHGRYGYLLMQGKIPTEEHGIKPGTSWLVTEVLTTKLRRWQS
jgi:hypothetical protein